MEANQPVAADDGGAGAAIGVADADAVGAASRAAAAVNPAAPVRASVLGIIGWVPPVLRAGIDNCDSKRHSVEMTGQIGPRSGENQSDRSQKVAESAGRQAARTETRLAKATMLLS